MRDRRKANNLVKSLSVLLCSLILNPLSVSVAFAVPAIPEYGVNHATKECSVFRTGDECTACRMPQGWVSLGAGVKDFCPEGYKRVEVSPQCFPSKNPFCCTKGHSGSPGNCQDLVIDEERKKCSFVDDIEKCVKLPRGWQRPKSEQVCPSLSYGWLETLLACPGEYAPPLVDGKRVDWCLTWGTDCGQPAADHFCKIQGYAGAETWRWEYVEPTIVLGDGNQCSGKRGCGGFSFIRCTQANP